jgi:hypothetical protein
MSSRDQKDYKFAQGFAASSSYAAASSSAAAATASAPWREAVKRRSAAIISPVSSPTHEQGNPKKLKEETAAASLSASSQALGIKGIRQTIIRQSLLERGGECVLVTGEGERCDRATQYIRDQGIEGKERSLDCLSYCRDHCKEWARRVLQNPPRGVVVYADGIAIGRFPIRGGEVRIEGFGFEALEERNGEWYDEGANKVLYIEPAVTRFCDHFAEGRGQMQFKVTTHLKDFRSLGRRQGRALMAKAGVTSLQPNVAEWKQLISTKKVTFRFEGTAYPEDGTWIGKSNMWRVEVHPRQNGLEWDTLVFSTAYPMLILNLDSAFARLQAEDEADAKAKAAPAASASS